MKTIKDNVGVCKHAHSDMTPCYYKDGSVCLTDDGVCVGCGFTPQEIINIGMGNPLNYNPKQAKAKND